jgi:DNA (cytosine-5)-methyltransferase 1
MKPVAIDLFAGCGGLSLGLQQAGFDHLFAIEANQDAFSTYHQNLVSGTDYEKRWPNWLEQKAHDILEVLDSKRTELIKLRGKVDLIAGGPPCQGFSMNGRRDPDDPRSQMINAYFEFVRLVKPKVVLLENVQGFISMPHQTHGTYPNFAKSRLKELGYDSFETVVSASEFGVPQRRPRYILIGMEKGSLPGVNPIERLRVGRKSFLEALGLTLEPTGVADALRDLETNQGRLIDDRDFGSQGFKALDYRAPKEKSAYIRLMRDGWQGKLSDMRLARHSKEVVKRMQKILKHSKRGQTISAEQRLQFGIKKRSITPLDPKAPAPTITTLPDDLVHYSEPRTMTVREHARIQSFPDWFQFCGPYTTGGDRRKTACPRYTQVGNAVPPLLARAIGLTICSILRDQDVFNFPHRSQMLSEIRPVVRKVSDSHARLAVAVID